MKNLKIEFRMQNDPTAPTLTAKIKVSQEDHDKYMAGDFKLICDGKHKGKTLTDSVEWKRLKTIAGLNLRSPALILNRFYILQKMGWTIEGIEMFTSYYW